MSLQPPRARASLDGGRFGCGAARAATRVAHNCSPCVLPLATALRPSLSKEIEDVLGPELFEVYQANLKPKVAANGRGASYTGTAAPALPKPALAPGVRLEKSGTLKRTPAAVSAGAKTMETHQVMWTSYGPIPSHSYVESERIDSLEEWFVRYAMLRSCARIQTGGRADLFCPSLILPLAASGLVNQATRSANTRTQSGRRRGDRPAGRGAMSSR